jgi:succinate-semialdehyde dehydrogenase/glutarate-semialdehyde dehydrogenase
VAKPSELAPLSPIEVARCFVDAGIPPGVLNLVVGDPVEVGEELVANPISRKIAFIGSDATVKNIMRRAADHLKRITLELGGHAPVIIFDDLIRSGP